MTDNDMACGPNPNPQPVTHHLTLHQKMKEISKYEYGEL